MLGFDLESEILPDYVLRLVSNEILQSGVVHRRADGVTYWITEYGEAGASALPVGEIV